MNDIIILYASHDGHTRKIVGKLAEEIRQTGAHVGVYDLAVAAPPLGVLEQARALVLMAAIRYGHPLPAARHFLKDYADLIQHKRLGLFLVNLTARKPHKRSLEGSPYLRKFIEKHDLSPFITEAIAGKLDYARYGWLDRTMIRLIMRITGGPTDLSTCKEFTDWAQVQRLAKEISEKA